MRILFTGLSGKIGRAIAPLLWENYPDAYALSHIKPVDGFSEVTFASIPDSLDLIVHLAANSSIASCEANPCDAYRTNVGLTETLSELAPVILLSSDMVFPGEMCVSYNEGSSPVPKCVYGRTKAAAEKAVLSKNGKVIRIGNTFGMDGGITDPVYQAAKGGKQCFWDNVWIRPTYIEDIASALHAVIEYKGRDAVFHVACTGEPVTRLDFAYLAAGMYPGFMPVFASRSLSNDELETRSQYSSLDTTHTQDILGIRMHSVHEALRKDAARYSWPALGFLSPAVSAYH